MNYQDNHVTLYNHDCLAMPELGDNSIQCVVTSPPYWGLRKYSGEQDLVWGNKDCEHQWGNLIPNPMNKSGKHGPASILTKTADEQHAVRKESNQGAFCSLCGAWKGAYGLEPTLEMYVQHTIEILREIRRVLRKGGVVFWNIGDSYSSGDRKTNKPQTVAGGSTQDLPLEYSPSRNMGKHQTIKPKDLCLIPFRVAIAAQTDGWWVRSVIIWSKPNPMPESVTDRPTESHEYILMLTKSAKYYWDADAVREPQQMSSLLRATRGWEGDTDRGYPNGPQSHIDKYFNKSHEEAMSLPGRNIRSVWTINTQSYEGAHFATFPEKLPELCIKAATKENDLVLDPFAGAGTTLWVAKKLGRRAVGYELSEEYCQLIIERNRQQAMI